MYQMLFNNVIISTSPQLCCVCFAALHTHSTGPTPVIGEQFCAGCSNINNDEKFRAQSLQQLQYRATQQVLFKKNVYLSEKN